MLRSESGGFVDKLRIMLIFGDLVNSEDCDDFRRFNILQRRLLVNGVLSFEGNIFLRGLFFYFLFLLCRFGGLSYWVFGVIVVLPDKS